MYASAVFLAVSLLAVVPSAGEMFLVNNNNMFGGRPYIENEHGHRLMQWAGENRPDLNATDDVCRVAGSRFECYVGTRISSEDESYSDLQITINCQLDSQTAFDYRRSQSCTCTSKTIPSDPDKPEKTCPCTVCPLGFGRNPINIDCSQNEEDPFIINTCSSLDCDFACNGTCRYDCFNSGPECPFCSNNPLAPTPSPTGEGLGKEGGSGASFACISGLIVLGIAGFFGLLV